MTIDWSVEPLPGQAAPSPQAGLLKAAVLSLPEERFAVLDGALHDDLATELSIHGLTARPLFLEAGGPQAVASGPFLLRLADAVDLDRLLACIGARRAPVFWSWRAGEAALYRHLRTLNLAEIPNTHRISGDRPTRNAVIFRHWDAIVLRQTLPLLRSGQIARVFGAGAALCFTGPDGPTTAHRPPGLPAPETGMLVFSAEQMRGMTSARVQDSRRRIAGYLRETIPEKVGGLDDMGLQQLIARCETAGRALGLKGERSLGLWCFLWLRTDGAVETSYEIRHLLTGAGMNPEQALDAFLGAFIATATSR